MKPCVTVLVEHRYRRQTQPAGLIGALHEAGALVWVTSDDRLGRLDTEEVTAVLSGSDVVVVRGRSETLLAALDLAEAAGLRTVDAAAAIRAVRDKRIMGARLLVAGLPTPKTWTGTGPAVAPRVEFDLRHGRVDADCLIAKPVFGDNSAGITVHDVVASTSQDGRTTSVTTQPPLEDLAGELVVQEMVPSDGLDLKLYVIGEQVWATRKPSPVTPARRLPGPVSMTPRLRELALECGRLFGLTVYGVDCLETPDGPLVIEVNDFPNFTHVPAAPHLLAEHVLRGAA